MRIIYLCPNCQETNWQTVTEATEKLPCSNCEWTRPLPADPKQRQHPDQCQVCGCRDLWRQKDFPQRLGVAMVATGAILSTIAIYYYYHLWALGILMGFALVDMILFAVMPDVLRCYRCAACYRNFDPTGGTPYFNLETSERYRQEAIRLQKSSPKPLE
jgi:hypothetical protein